MVHIRKVPREMDGIPQKTTKEEDQPLEMQEPHSEWEDIDDHSYWPDTNNHIPQTLGQQEFSNPPDVVESDPDQDTTNHSDHNEPEPSPNSKPDIANPGALAAAADIIPNLQSGDYIYLAHLGKKEAELILRAAKSILQKINVMNHAFDKFDRSSFCSAEHAEDTETAFAFQGINGAFIAFYESFEFLKYHWMDSSLRDRFSTLYNTLYDDRFRVQRNKNAHRCGVIDFPGVQDSEFDDRRYDAGRFWDFIVVEWGSLEALTKEVEDVILILEHDYREFPGDAQTPAMDDAYLWIQSELVWEQDHIKPDVKILELELKEKVFFQVLQRYKQRLEQWEKTLDELKKRMFDRVLEKHRPPVEYWEKALDKVKMQARAHRIVEAEKIVERRLLEGKYDCVWSPLNTTTIPDPLKSTYVGGIFYNGDSTGFDKVPDKVVALLSIWKIASSLARLDP